MSHTEVLHIFESRHWLAIFSLGLMAWAAVGVALVLVSWSEGRLLMGFLWLIPTAWFG